MIVFDDERPCDSPFVERIWRSHSVGTYPFLSIAESRCELVVSRMFGRATLTVRGPETRATPFGDCPADGEWLGIRLTPGTSVSLLPAGALVDAIAPLPTISRTSFWLAGTAWQFPTFENAEIFVDWLVRAGVLVRDELVGVVLQGKLKGLSSRTVQRRFVQATGITQGTARQIERARYATLLLRGGASIPDTIMAAGYCDQPHLTRALKHFIGQTPVQLRDHKQSAQLSFLYNTTPFC